MNLKSILKSHNYMFFLGILALNGFMMTYMCKSFVSDSCPPVLFLCSGLQVLIPMLVSVLGHKYIELSVGISMTL